MAGGFFPTFLSMTQNLQKDLLRKQMLEKRLAMTPEEVNSLSQQIQARVLKHSLWKKSERVGFYAGARHEVETHLLFMKALEESKTVYFPRVEQGLKFYEVTEPADLEKGAWGIMEPKHSCKPLASEETLDLLIVPGVAFDKRGFRLGFGRAFYDAILERFSDVSVGLAYDYQMVEVLPTDPWDKKVSRVITEKAEYPITT